MVVAAAICGQGPCEDFQGCEGPGLVVSRDTENTAIVTAVPDAEEQGLGLFVQDAAIDGFYTRGVRMDILNTRMKWEFEPRAA